MSQHPSKNTCPKKPKNQKIKTFTFGSNDRKVLININQISELRL